MGYRIHERDLPLPMKMLADAGGAEPFAVDANGVAVGAGRERS